MDDKDRKRPREASSFDDSISKAANFMQLYEKFGTENE